MSLKLNLKRGDTRTAIKANLKSPKGNPIILTDAIVTFHMIQYKTIIANREADIIDATNGIVAFTFTPEEISSIGKMKAEFKVTYPDQSIETFPNQGYIDITIEPSLI